MVPLNYASTTDSNIYGSKKLCGPDLYSVTLTQVVRAKLACVGPTTPRLAHPKLLRAITPNGRKIDVTVRESFWNPEPYRLALDMISISLGRSYINRRPHPPRRLRSG
jgi:hypothetical protein